MRLKWMWWSLLPSALHWWIAAAALYWNAALTTRSLRGCVGRKLSPNIPSFPSGSSAPFTWDRSLRNSSICGEESQTETGIYSNKHRKQFLTVSIARSFLFSISNFHSFSLFSFYLLFFWKTFLISLLSTFSFSFFLSFLLPYLFIIISNFDVSFLFSFPNYC